MRPFHAVIAGTWLAWVLGQTPQPAYDTDELFTTIAAVVDSFGTLEHHPPESFTQACLGVLASGSYARYRGCEYWLHHRDTIPVDGWRTPLSFRTDNEAYEMKSAGPDRAFGTADDIVLNTADEHRRVVGAAGCYTITSPEWTKFGAAAPLQLDATPRWTRSYRAGPRVRYYQGPSWSRIYRPFAADSFAVMWSEIHRAVVISFTIQSDTLRGVADGRPFHRTKITGIRRPCEGDAMLAERIPPPPPKVPPSRCPAPDTLPMRISADSIGPLSLRAAVRDLKAYCPIAASMPLFVVNSRVRISLAFPFRGLYAVALQDGEDSVPTAWSITGTRGVLPEGVKFNARFGELARAYGTAYAASEGGRVMVRFCRFPEFAFVLDPEDVPGTGQDDEFDVGRIPADARIFSISIARGRQANPVRCSGASH